MGRKRKIQDSVLHQMEEDQEAISFITLNAPYLTMTAIQTALRLSHEKLLALVAASKADVSEEGKEPRASDIAREVGFLPIGTVVEQWQRGTTIHLGSNIPGITRITRHYAMGDE